MTRNFPIRSSGDGKPAEAGKGFMIKTCLLIPGRGDPIRNATVVIEHGKIEHVGPSAELPAMYTTYPMFTVPVLMPGMWDCHLHYMGMVILNIDSFVTTPQVCHLLREPQPFIHMTGPYGSRPS